MNHKDDSKDFTRTIVMVGFEGAAALDITGPHEVFGFAAHILKDIDESPYKLILMAEKAGPFRTSRGLKLVADGSWRDFQDSPDTLLVAGGPDVSCLIDNKEFLAWLRAMADNAIRIGSVCTGAFALAEAGLLDGRRATTHWSEVEHLKNTYPKVTVEADSIFVRDGNICTSAGVTAGMDLALALVEEDHGREVALSVARMMVLYLKRPGGQSQFSTLLQAQTAQGKRLATLLAWLDDNYRLPLTVEELAAKAAMSPRTFARVFLAETGVTPAHHLEKIRLERAVRHLETTGTSLETAARECGFTGCEQLRRAFQRHLGITPQEYRERFRTSGTGARRKNPWHAKSHF